MIVKTHTVRAPRFRALQFFFGSPKKMEKIRVHPCVFFLLQITVILTWKSTEKKNEAIDKTLKNKKQTVEEIEKQREEFFESRKKHNQDAKDASKFLKKYANKDKKSGEK